MKYLGLIPLSVASLLIGCETDSTPTGAATPSAPLTTPPQGDVRYNTHFEKGSTAFKCNVYATDKVVSVDMSLNMVNDQSWVRARYNLDYGASSYNGSMESAGLFDGSIGAECEKIKADCAEMNNAKVSCSANKITFAAEIPYVDPIYYTMNVNKAVSIMSSLCDNLYEEYYNAPMITPGEGNESKKALTCDVQVNGTSFTQTVTYSDKSMVLSTTLANGVYAVTESYTGIDAATLAQVCAAYKQETQITNVNCSGSTITYTPVVNPDFNSLVQFAQEMECPAFLNGSYTFEDVWFGQD